LVIEKFSHGGDFAVATLFVFVEARSTNGRDLAQSGSAVALDRARQA
jgi:hypothetical protein